MFTRSLRWRAFLFAASILVAPMIYGQGGNTGPPPIPMAEPGKSAAPPVEQALIPEGVFAIRLAEALELGRTEDEAQAESLLSGVGIEPKNGWITQYPVTPAVIGDIEKALSTAADNGKLSMPKDQALKALADVKTQLDLNIATETAPPAANSKPVEITIYKYTDRKGIVHITNEYDAIPEEYRSQAIIVRHVVKPQSARERPITPASEYTGDQYAGNQDPETINNYYYVEGPPVVTYYPPPEPYGYLYSWTPYPFWSSGVYFPGFFVLHNFHRHVWFNRKPYITSFHFHGGGFWKKFARNPTGGTFQGGSASRRDRVPSPQIFYPPQIQRNARTIFNRNRHAFSGVPPAPRVKTPPFSPRQSIGVPHVHPSPFRGPMDVPRRNPGFYQGHGGGIFNPPKHNRGYGYLSPPRGSVLRPAVPRLAPRFSPGNNGFRGFHSGNGGGFGGGFRGGAGFGRHGNASGGMKGGRR